MLSFGSTWFYEPSPYHRYQADALLHGHLCLSNSVNAMHPGLAWHDGHVQQVWGLGVGLWLLPFQAVWHLVGGRILPDRVVLGLAFALLAFFSGSTGLKLINQGNRSYGLGVMWMVTLCPALWTLTRSSEFVFEETVLYSVILSLGILVSLIRVASFGLRMDYAISCALSAFAVWVRPTHAIYGLGGVLAASWSMWIYRRSWKEAIFGFGFWCASFSLLAWTNNVRFGSPAEFGHHLTVSSANMIYLTRFGNPFRQASLLQAAKELLGLLFFVPPHGKYAFGENLFPGQAPFPRWRMLDLTTFDPVWMFICIAAFVSAIAWLILKRKKNRYPLLSQPQSVLVFSLLLWVAVSIIVLSCFYLYYPAIASRYLLDFAPALTGSILLGCALMPPRVLKIMLPVAVIWLVYEAASAKVPAESQFVRNLALQQPLPMTQGMSLKNFNGKYTPDHHPSATRIKGNGDGWEPETGFASDIVSLVVDDPEFVDLRVSGRRKINSEPAPKDIYRAQIDGVSLPIRSVLKDGDEFDVTFELPRAIRSPHQNQILFLCFSDGYDMEDRESERFLYSVRWR